MTVRSSPSRCQCQINYTSRKSNISLRHTYTLIAPFYDAIVARATDRMRRDSLQQLGNVNAHKILLAGYGTGLDNPYLPPHAEYTALDITPGMLSRASQNMKIPVSLSCGNVMRMPYINKAFDAVILHLILAVVPRPVDLLHETARVLKPGGRVYILDKFIRPGQLALTRRLLNLVMQHVATRTDVVFEKVLAEEPSFRLVSDEPCMAGGWFRRIVLEKKPVDRS